MMSIMNILMIKNDFIIASDEVYDNLKNYEELFAKEAMILNYVKCELLQNDDLDDFSINGIDVFISYNNDYYLKFDDKTLIINVKDKQIMDYRYE